MKAGGSNRNSTVSSKLLVTCKAERMVTSRRADPSKVTAITTKTRSSSRSKAAAFRLLGELCTYCVQSYSINKRENQLTKSDIPLHIGSTLQRDRRKRNQLPSNHPIRLPADVFASGDCRGDVIFLYFRN